MKNKILTSEEFERDNSYINDIPMELNTKYEFAKAYAEYYHKAKVKAISDEEMNDVLFDYLEGKRYKQTRLQAFVYGVREFKNKLLNDL